MLTSHLSMGVGALVNLDHHWATLRPILWGLCSRWPPTIWENHWDQLLWIQAVQWETFEDDMQRMVQRMAPKKVVQWTGLVPIQWGLYSSSLSSLVWRQMRRRDENQFWTSECVSLRLRCKKNVHSSSLDKCTCLRTRLCTGRQKQNLFTVDDVYNQSQVFSGMKVHFADSGAFEDLWGLRIRLGLLRDFALEEGMEMQVLEFLLPDSGMKIHLAGVLGDLQYEEGNNLSSNFIK